jgi:hypothetical protein
MECFHPQGMSLRDYFAAQAIAPIAALGVAFDTADQWSNYLAGESYRLADAMIAARTNGAVLKSAEPVFATVREAQKANLCRVCGKPVDHVRPSNPILLNYGAEFAHQDCANRCPITK